MKTFVLVLLLSMVSLFPRSTLAVSEEKVNHLFCIERSKNKNLVQYDIRLTGDSGLPDPTAINVYWILENGTREELNPIEKGYAYGIARQEKLGKDKFKVIVAGLKGLEIIVEKMNDVFRATVSINGRASILERIYIRSEEKLTGLPRVLYIELLGRAKEMGLPIRERISPK